MPVTCMVHLTGTADRDVLLSGSTDKSVRVWDLASGDCMDTWKHRGTVKAAVDLGGGLCCTGGKDLSVWSTADGRCLSKIAWDDTYDADIRALIAVDDGKAVVAECDDKQLHVYSVKRGVRGGAASDELTVELVAVKTLEGHREPVQCLHKVSENMFASGSLDGTVCLWDATNLRVTRVLNFHESCVAAQLRFVAVLVKRQGGDVCCRCLQF
jgi:WD40 repeat protein